MKRNVIGFSLFIVLSLTLMSVSAMAQATSSTTTERFPISGTITACNGEAVNYEGTVQLVQHFTVSSSGQVNIKEGISINVHGVGQVTGAKYVGNQTSEFAEHFDSTDFAPFNLTNTFHFKLNGQGRVPNTSAKGVFHVTVNANGDKYLSKINLVF